MGVILLCRRIQKCTVLEIFCFPCLNILPHGLKPSRLLEEVAEHDGSKVWAPMEKTWGNYLS